LKTNGGQSRRFRVAAGAPRRAAVLVLVLAVMSALSLLALGLCHRARLELKMARIRSEQVRSHYLAIGGLQRALLAIRGDADEKIDHFGEAWRLATSAEQEGLLTVAGESPGEERGGGDDARVYYAVSDEEGLLNVNTGSPATWMILPGMDETIASAIPDWQDADESPMRGGAESSYYERLDEPYRAKNEPMALIWELALVKGVEWTALVGAGPGAAGLVDRFTVCGDGKINLNTASAEVLSTLPGIGPEGARALAEWRVGSDGRPFTADDRFFSAGGDVVQVPGLTERQAELLMEYGSVSTRHFRVYVEARVRPEGRPYRLSAGVRRNDGELRLIWVRPMSF